MPANVSEMMYVGAVPWHGLGVSLRDYPTWEEAIVAAGLDWTVSLQPIATTTEAEGNTPFPLVGTAIPSHRAVVRDDTGDVLGVVSHRYQPIQNRSSLAFFNPMLRDGLGTFETAGVIGHGERIWMLARTDKLDIRLPDSDYEAYLLFAAAHDGSGAAIGKLVQTRVVCANTLAMSLSERGFSVSVRHMGDVEAQLAAAGRIMAAGEAARESFQAFATRLASIPFQSLMKPFVNKVIPLPLPPAPDADHDTVEAIEKAAARVEERQAEVIELFKTGAGNVDTPAAGTAWAALNAVTDYADHMRAASGRVRNRVSYALLGGPGDLLKRRATNIISSMTNVPLALAA